MTSKSVAIAGAGVAGLACALSLARKGIPSDIIEQAHHLREVGAGLQISPNAARILDTLGVLPDLEKVWNEPARIRLVDGVSLKDLLSIPVGSVARSRWKAPYGVLHRSTLQQALLQTVEKNPLCTLHMARRLEHTAHETVSEITGREHRLIVGADGVWSRTRNSIADSPQPSFSGNIAWRFTIKAADAPEFLKPDSVTAFTGASAHIVAYPLHEVGGFNIVAIVSGADPGQTWNAQSGGAQMAILLKHFEPWNPHIKALLDRAGEANFWPLWRVSDGNWHNGKDTVLIGDAAHAMMPYAAQGAAMAIEDAFELVEMIADTDAVAPALDAWQSLRKPRIAKARRRGTLNGIAYHATGPAKLARNLVFALKPAGSFISDLDWLYGYGAAR